MYEIIAAQGKRTNQSYDSYMGRCGPFQMTINYKDFTIDIIDDSDYTPNSSDNFNTYDKVFLDDAEFQPASKHGIKVSKNGVDQTSAIICETGGATGIHDNSFVIQGDNLFLCCCDKVYSLGLPDLKLNWKNKLDTATCFGIHSFKNDLLNCCWDYSGLN